MASRIEGKEDLEHSLGGLGFLQDEKEGLNRIKEEAQKFNTLFLLEDRQWSDYASQRLHHEATDHWPNTERKSYLEALGRLQGGLAQCRVGEPWPKGLLYECKRLASKLEANREVGVDNLLELGAMFWAKQNDTNAMKHDLADTYARLIDQAAEDYVGDREAVAALENPYQVRPGTKVFYLSEKRQLESLEVLTCDVTNGNVVLSNQKSINLHQFNKLLASGRYMLEHGDNFFGGVELLQQPASFYQVGKKTAFRFPVIGTREGKIINSNMGQLEDVFGKAYLAHLGELVLLDIEYPDGDVQEGVRLHQLSKSGSAAK